jgi:universal stress protein A
LALHLPCSFIVAKPGSCGPGESTLKADLILVPFDFTPASEAALETATLLAMGSGGKLVIVHVREPQYSTTSGNDSPAEPDHRAQQLYQELVAIQPNLDVPSEHRLLNGSTVATILDFAQSEHIDMIVVGTHGRCGLDQMLMGSVSDAITRRASCPVIKVKTTAGCICR